jgi:hypothetical protein
MYLNLTRRESVAAFRLASSKTKYYYIRAALLVGRSRDRSPVVSLVIFSVVPSDRTMCPEVESASENEYQGFLLG